MSGDEQNASEAKQQSIDEHFADTIDADDPHKVEKLANVGKDKNAAEASE